MDALQRVRSEGELEPELDGARRAKREHACSYAHTNRCGIRACGPVYRPRAAEEDSGQDIARNIKIGKIEKVIETNARLDRDLPVLHVHPAGPGQTRIERL